jgi:hypothetical protein
LNPEDNPRENQCSRIAVTPLNIGQLLKHSAELLAAKVVNANSRRL